MPSGREEAIETLVDMDPQGNFFRAARVLVSFPFPFEKEILDNIQLRFDIVFNLNFARCIFSTH